MNYIAGHAIERPQDFQGVARLDRPWNPQESPTQLYYELLHPAVPQHYTRANFQKILQQIQTLEEIGVSHNDIKADNMMVRRLPQGPEGEQMQGMVNEGGKDTVRPGDEMVLVSKLY